MNFTVTEEYAYLVLFRESAVGVSGQGSVLSASRVSGDELGVSPLQDRRGREFSPVKLGGTAFIDAPYGNTAVWGFFC